MRIFSINLFGKNTNISSTGATTVQTGNNQNASAAVSSNGDTAIPVSQSPAPSGTSGLSPTSDISSWASELGMGSFTSETSTNGVNWYTFANGNLGIDPATGATTQISEGGTQAPWNVAQLAIEQGMGTLQSTSTASSGTTYTFANGSVSVDASGNVNSASGGSGADPEIKNMGSMFGFGAFQQVTTTADNPPQKKYDFANGTIWTNPNTGGVNGVQPTSASTGFDGNVAAIAYLRGFGAFKSVDTNADGFTFHFQLGDITQVKNSDGSSTVSSATVHS